MKALLQRVSEAKVEVVGEGFSAINSGILVLLGIAKGDEKTHAETLAKKILEFRIFEDENERMNLSVQQVKGDLLVVSQFTLCADNRKGTKPSFDPTAPAATAEPLYEHFVSCLKGSGLTVKTGKFGAFMRVHLVNEGPASFILEASLPIHPS